MNVHQMRASRPRSRNYKFLNVFDEAELVKSSTIHYTKQDSLNVVDLQ